MLTRHFSLRPAVLSLAAALSLAATNIAPAAALPPIAVSELPPQSNDTDQVPANSAQETAEPTAWAREILDSDPNMLNPWSQAGAPMQNVHWQRRAENYRAVIDQFDVQHSHPGRYKRGGAGVRSSRCNIFAGDVMRAMGVPLPTKGELGTGHGNLQFTDTTTANATDLFRWLSTGYGGWYRIDPNNPNDLGRLLDHLKDGKPTLASDSGHIAVVRPDHLPNVITPYNLGDLHVAQAGAFNYNDIALWDVSYGDKFKPVFFIHE